MTATVRNVSAAGLGVDVALPAPAEGESLAVTLQPPGAAPIAVVAVVWHARTVRRARDGERYAQLGLVLSEAGERYASFVGALLPAGPAAKRPAADAGSPPRLRFAVQVAESGRPRTRRLVVLAEGAADASRIALAETGPGWAVVDVRPARA